MLFQFVTQRQEKFFLYKPKVAIKAQGNDIAAHMDKQSIIIATQNLIMNALRFTQTQINVSFYCDGERCEIKVEDDGPGFEGKGKQLLAAFARDKDQSDSSGYGLGLYIVHKVAIWHQGALTLQPSTLLGGACLCIRWRNHKQR
ncbi:hypothetical protein TUM3794_07530 [Shewanella colwelliana]|uniref:histidine kinase n=1 Tax=Shewanella colwelliana TaxID=23 RepID=A0ABQ4NVX7_SHECO|nr:hypothetical protein TUM3794_07530 [Shewanella colwelliana]